MSTDQIQSKLYERSDKETEARVQAAAAPLLAFVGKRLANNWTVKVRGSAIVARDGTKLVPSMNADDIKHAVFNAPVMLVRMDDVLAEVRATLKELCTSVDRQEYVKQFLQDFDTLKAQVAEFSDRLSDVENSQ